MRFNSVPAILGAATVAAISTVATPEVAKSATFQLESGVTSVGLDLPLLQSLGLNITGTNGVVNPVSSDFLVGFPITPATTFQFSFDSASGFAPVAGSILHTGSVTFNNALTIGNFLIGFDPVRALGNASGFFVQDTITTGAILFDVAKPRTVSFTPIAGSVPASGDLTLEGDLLVSPEFAGVLGNQSLAGGVVGAASVNGSAAVPEPTTILGVLAAGGFLAANRRRKAQG